MYKGAPEVLPRGRPASKNQEVVEGEPQGSPSLS